jgi:hypothetical protein
MPANREKVVADLRATEELSAKPIILMYIQVYLPKQ